MKYAISNVVGDPFWLTTMPMAIIGWVVALVGSILNNSLDPSHFPVFSWWGLAFEMIAILLTLHIALSDRIRQYKQALLAFLSIATIYTTNSTNNFVWRDNSSSGAAAAGYILLSIINFVWIMYFGTTSDEVAHRYVDSFATEKKPARPHLYDYSRGSNRARAGRSLPVMEGASHSRHPGTSSQPYRMSDVPQNVVVGNPVGFNRVTDETNPAGNLDPLSSTYLYSQDQLQRHGLSSYEIQPRGRNSQQTQSMGYSFHQDSNSALERFSAEFRDADDDARDLRDDELPSSPVAKAVARHSYEGDKNEGEFSFQHGDVLDVYDMEGNWWYCRASNGDEGICPSNYLEVLPAGASRQQLSETTQSLSGQNQSDGRLIDSW